MWILVKARSMFLETGPILPIAVVGVPGHTPLFLRLAEAPRLVHSHASGAWLAAVGQDLECPLEQQLDAPGTLWGQSTC